MSQTYKTEGVILKRWDYKEQDRMVRILTKDQGKITTRAISVRKHGAKLAGHVEPFIYADFFIARSKTIDILAGANSIDSNMSLRHSLHHNAIASFFTEIVDRFTEEQHSDPELFHLVKNFYSWVDAHDSNVLVLYAAIVQLFMVLGYHIELYTCHQCKKHIQQKGNKFHYGLWTVECETCSSHDETTQLDSTTIKILRFLVKAESFNDATQISFSQKEWTALDRFIRSLLHYHIDNEFRSEEIFLNIMNGVRTTET